DAHVTGLMAEHANIVGECGWQPSRVDDRRVSCPRHRSFSCHLSNVLLSRTVAVFTTDGKFLERRILKLTITRCPWHCLAAVTRHTTRQDRPVESVVPEFVPW